MAHRKSRISFLSRAIAAISLVLCCQFVLGVTSGGQNPNQQTPDGPISVHLGDVYKKGEIKIEDADLGN